MKRFLALMSVALFSLATALPVSAGEASPSCAYDKSSAPIASTVPVPAADSAATMSQDMQATIDATALPTVQERTQVAGLFSWFVWCPSLGTYTCQYCCPPISR